MKRVLFLSVAMFCINVCSAQLYLPKGASSVMKGGQGENTKRVGVNTGTPEAALHVYESSNPSILISSSPQGGNRMQLGVASCSGCYAKGAKSGDGVIRVLGATGNLIFTIPNDFKNGKSYIGISDDGNSLWARFCTNRTLYVDGSIYAKLIKVVETIPWPDYVFDESYKKPTISEIESYIAANKHLPDVPSAAVVEAEGIDVAEMSAILLRKIEELTLIVIEQNKAIENLKKQVGE